MISYDLATLNIHKLTQAQYNAAVAAGTIDSTALYLTPDEHPASIELIPASGSRHGGFIDFHYNGSAADYTTRLIETSSGELECTGNFTAAQVFGAVWNDFAEYRESNITEPGRVICENGDDTLSIATTRLQPGASVVSDTFGFAIGETDKAKTPIAVAGRVLVYTYENRYEYKPGDAVCAAPGGTVSKMTREEIMMYPERIVGTVSAIPEYETWGEGNVPVDGRIWIKVK